MTLTGMTLASRGLIGWPSARGPPYQTLQPPSTTRLWPVIQAPASDASSATAPLRSAGVPVRASGLARRQRSTNSGSVPGGRDLARGEAVDRDAVLGQLGRERPREVDDRALRRLVRRARSLVVEPGVEAVVRAEGAVDRAEGDDAAPAPGDHHAGRRLGGDVGARDVQLEGLSELVDRGVGQVGRGEGAAGVADHHVEAAAIGHHPADERLDLRLGRDVGAEAGRVETGRPELRGHALAPRGVAAREVDGRPELGEGLGHRAAEVRPAAGHDGGAAREVEEGLDAHGADHSSTGRGRAEGGRVVR